MRRLSTSQQNELVLPMEILESFYDEPGEAGWIMEGYKHSFVQSSVIVTNTAPRGGPPLHTHDTEEVHVLPPCRFAYTIGKLTFTVEGPSMVRIPSGVEHTFLNIGPEAVRLVAFWPNNKFWNNYRETGPNPLLTMDFAEVDDGSDVLEADSRSGNG
jgi:quercetin dioxygenase-like cupin family protein